MEEAFGTLEKVDGSSSPTSSVPTRPVRGQVGEQNLPDEEIILHRGGEKDHGSSLGRELWSIDCEGIRYKNQV